MNDLVHKIQRLETIQGVKTIKYSKCIRCGVVIFEEGDDYANQICPKAVQQREDLRKQL